jgi:cytochrome c-type biogenesis protein CcmE
MIGRLLGSRRAKLVGVLVVATLAITGLAVSAAGDSMSYYATPEEFAKQLDRQGASWRVGGRVLGDTVVEERGRPTSFTIQGDHGERMDIVYGGVKPDLFGPGAFVVVEGKADGPNRLKASSVIIKHENAFYDASPTGTPPAMGR